MRGSDWIMGATGSVVAMACVLLLGQPDLVLAASASAPSAVAPRMPTDAEINAQRVRMPSEAELARQPAPVMPRLDGMPVQKGVDAAALAAQYEAMQTAQSAGETTNERPNGGLFVFVTLAMPRASLQRLLDQAERTRATLVLRGVKDHNLQATLATVADLIGKRKVAWVIDPDSFTRYGVTHAPTIVLVAPGSVPVAGCVGAQCAADHFAKVVGDVSIAYAMDTVERQDASLRVMARAYKGMLEQRR